MNIAVITAPRRKPTIDRCLESIRNAGYKNPIHIFAEPGVDINYPDVHENSERLGAFGNYNRALTWMVENTKDSILILNDDLFLYKKAFDYINVTSFGYLCFCTREQDIPHNNRKKKGWIRIYTGFNTWGAGFLMKRQTVIDLINHPFYKNRLVVSPHKGIDAAVSESLLQMNYSMYVHNPSLSEHIGETTTINDREDWPDGGRCGFNFEKWK